MAVVDRARGAGLATALCMLEADDAAERERAPRIRELWPELRFAIGVHPHRAGTGAATDVPAVERRVREAIDATPLVRAVGEIGLDYHYDVAPRTVQQRVFRVQVRIARELALPVVVHMREAEADTLAILEQEGGGAVTGVIHCFTGGAETARRALDLGFHLSFSGIVTFPRAEAVRDAARLVPDDRLLVETDAPYLAPVPYRGQRNEPAWVTRVASAIAAVRGVSPSDMDGALGRSFASLVRP